MVIFTGSALNFVSAELFFAFSVGDFSGSHEGGYGNSLFFNLFCLREISSLRRCAATVWRNLAVRPDFLLLVLAKYDD
ncbi:MAG: hypothetical protein D8B56_09065 [Alloprevotella sp.]|nr:MAG: hypothetical protein D8B56_09065 [Alloprevotella sp.]